MSEPELPRESNEVSDSWQQMVQAVLGIVVLIGTVAIFHYYTPATAQAPQPDELQKQVHELTQQVAQLEQQQAMPALVLNRYRNSIGYIYGIYRLVSRTSRQRFARACQGLDSWWATGCWQRTGTWPSHGTAIPRPKR